MNTVLYLGEFQSGECGVNGQVRECIWKTLLSEPALDGYHNGLSPGSPEIQFLSLSML